ARRLPQERAARARVRRALHPPRARAARGHRRGARCGAASECEHAGRSARPGIGAPGAKCTTSRLRQREDRRVTEGLVLLLVGAIFAASIVVALGAARTGLPVLVAFLGLGMLLGSDGPGGIEFDDAERTRQARTVGLALILYTYGLSPGVPCACTSL